MQKKEQKRGRGRKGRGGEEERRRGGGEGRAGQVGVDPVKRNSKREGAGDAVLISIWELVSMATEKIWQLHWERLPQQQHPGGYQRRRSQKERRCKQRWEGWEKRQPGARWGGEK